MVTARSRDKTPDTSAGGSSVAVGACLSGAAIMQLAAPLQTLSHYSDLTAEGVRRIWEVLMP
jgi:hypothetical protein